jgi:IS1 family transposase
MHNLSCKKLQCDEIWSFVYAKDKKVPAIDADTKLVPAWFVGLRNADYAYAFANDLKSRLANRVQVTTDGHGMYLEAMEHAFGADIDYGMLVKLYGPEVEEGRKRYSPAKCLSATKHVVQGKPNYEAISTSYVERQNLTMRMNMRRFTRLTNAFSKKLENHEYALALYFMHYNFARAHKTLANPYPKSPAMAAGLTNHIWTIEEIVKLAE